jgi:uncharacterized membrane protein
VRVAALLFALSAAASWGIGGILLKRGLDTVAPTTILVVQYVVGLVAVGGWVLVTAGAASAIDEVERRWAALLVLVSIQIAGYIFFLVAIKNAGEGSLPTATVIAICACYPALVAVLSGPFLDERLAWNDVLGVTLVILGVVATQLR